MSSQKSRPDNNLRWGRFWLVFIFLMLRGIDCYLYFSSFAANRWVIFAVIINGNLWSIVLLTAIWFRKSWAHHMMVILIFIWLGLALIFKDPIARFFSVNYALSMVILTAGYLVAALILLCFPSVKKLTFRPYG